MRSDFDSASWLKPQYLKQHVALQRPIILPLIQPVIIPTNWCCYLSEQVANTKLVFGLIVDRTNDIPHSEREHKPLYKRRHQNGSKGDITPKYIINNISASVFAYNAVTLFRWNNRNNIVDDVNISFNIRDFEFF